MSEESSVIDFNFALLGDSSVGKSAIFKKISKGTFYDDCISTVGADKVTIDCNDTEIEINGKIEKKSFSISLFDTAGQERYRSITKNYFKGSDGIILIYDITNKESFKHVEVWFHNIKEVLSDWKTSNYLIMLLGNKLDLVEGKEQEQNRKVNAEEAKKKCEDEKIQWGGECSAKEFSDEKFKDLFKEFAVNIYKKFGNNKINNQHSKIIQEKKKFKFC